MGGAGERSTGHSDGKNGSPLVLSCSKTHVDGKTLWILCHCSHTNEEQAAVIGER